MKIFDVSQGVADLIFNAANIGLIVGAALVLVATIAVFWTGGIRERYAEIRISGNEAETAKANADVGKANAEITKAKAAIAEANARALEAQLALEKFKAAREIPPEQRARIAEKLKQFSGQEFIGLVATSVGDAWGLWQRINLTLEMAGWVRLPPPGLAVGTPPAGVPRTPDAGVIVFFYAQLWADLHLRAEALAAALTAEGIPAGAGPAPVPSVQNPRALAIVIGPKSQ
jgi:hypothetical protein